MDSSKKSTYITAGISFIIIIIAVYFLFIFQKSPDKLKSDNNSAFVESIEAIDIKDRPFVTLTPTADGAEIIISIENMSAFDRIEYELTYQADNPQSAGNKIQRGSVETDVDTSQQKYKKSLLLGTASRGVRSPDTGVTDGELRLRLFNGDTEYVSETYWDRFEIGTAGGEIINNSGDFSLDVPGLDRNHWVIVADTVGIPLGAEFSHDNANLPVFGTFAIAAEFRSSADLSIKTSASQAELYSYRVQDSTWEKLESTIQDGEIISQVDSFATFVIVSSQ